MCVIRARRQGTYFCSNRRSDRCPFCCGQFDREEEVVVRAIGWYECCGNWQHKGPWQGPCERVSERGGSGFYNGKLC